MAFNNLSYHIWLFGNYTLDSKIFIENDKEIIKQSYGGSVNFGSTVIRDFFISCSYKVFSNGYPPNIEGEKSLQDLKIPYRSRRPNTSDAPNLTHYILDYRSEPRKLKLDFYPIKQIDLPEKSEEKPEIIMITPVYHEISEELVSRLRKDYPDAVISCDPQGWCRDTNEKDEITIKQWMPTNELLTAISIIKLSSEDLKRRTSQELEEYIKRITDYGVILIITAGIHGSICFLKGIHPYCLYIPVKKISKVVDATGAGDVWLLTFTIIYYNSKNIEQSLGAASIFSSLKIQAEGLNFAQITEQELINEIFSATKEIQSMEFSEGIKKVFSFNKNDVINQ